VVGVPAAAAGSGTAAAGSTAAAAAAVVEAQPAAGSEAFQVCGGGVAKSFLPACVAPHAPSSTKAFVASRHSNVEGANMHEALRNVSAALHLHQHMCFRHT
jgi:hypothetical protein